MTKYIYIGNGAGIPGLPHEITEEEAKTLGVEDLLKEAIQNGSYAQSDSHGSLFGKRKEKSAAKE